MYVLKKYAGNTSIICEYLLSIFIIVHIIKLYKIPRKEISSQKASMFVISEI